jgi:hypothetical protein
MNDGSKGYFQQINEIMEGGGKRSATPLLCWWESGVALRLPPHSIADGASLLG